MLITNNEDLSQHITSCRFINGTALDVLVHVRNLVHSGSILITHPLCGNLRPSHQPFRSVIIDMREVAADLESLKLIEEAVRIYQSSKIIAPDELNDDVRRDYAYIDSELMRESLEQCRLFNADGLKFSAPLLLMKKEGC